MQRNFAWRTRELGLQNTLDQDWRTYGTQAQNGTRNKLRGICIHCCPNFLFTLPDKRPHIVQNMCVCVCVYIYIYTHTVCMYVYIHISDCVQTVHELPLLRNNTVVKHFYTNRERCEVLIGYLSLGRRPGGDWANTWHWTQRISLLLVKTNTWHWTELWYFADR